MALSHDQWHATAGSSIQRHCNSAAAAAAAAVKPCKSQALQLYTMSVTPWQLLKLFL